jgi:hypothetical protein
VEITVVSDIDECWMLKDVVQQLKLNVKSDSIGKPKFGYLGQQMFEFGGTVTLQWIWKDKSESRKCRVIPRLGFEIYIPSSILPPRSPKQSGPVIHNSISSPPPPDSTPSSSSSSATRTSIEFSGAFDGDGLPEFPDTSEKYCIHLVIETGTDKKQGYLGRRLDEGVETDAGEEEAESMASRNRPEQRKTAYKDSSSRYRC